MPTGRLDVTVAIPGVTPPGAHQIVEFNATSATSSARTLGGPLQVTAATPGSESVVPISAPTQNADVAGSVESSSGSGSMAYTGTEPALLIVVGASILILGGPAPPAAPPADRQLRTAWPTGVWRRVPADRGMRESRRFTPT